MSALLLRNTAPASGGEPFDLLAADGMIEAMGKHLPCPQGARVIDAAGATLLPAFVDLHAHFRDPGLTHKEDIHTGCRAAVSGGYTTVNLMPNTSPVCSDMETVRYVREKAREAGLCDVHQTVSITSGFDGKDLSHLEGLDDSIRWLTDDGFGVDDTATMLKAMEWAKAHGMGVMLHEEDSGLKGVDSYLAEELMTFRDIQLAGLTGCPTHFCHVSTINAMDYIIKGKQQHANLTCEVSPHHLALNDSHGGKVNPPLRGEEHRQHLIRCLKAGVVDAIATDHAPHTAQEKAAGANGFVGLELAFATCYTALVREGHITLEELSRLMSRSPARILGVDRGELLPGKQADLVLVNLDKPFTVTEAHLYGKSKNSPMLGKVLYGEINMTIKRGTVVYEKAD